LRKNKLNLIPPAIYFLIKSKKTSYFTVSAEARERNLAAKNEFKCTHPCPGNVLDHITALAYGGADSPSNIQWQSVAYSNLKH